MKESEKTFGAHVDKAYLAQSAPKLVERTQPPKLRVLSFYMTCYSREGSPKPDRNPVIILSTATSTGEEKQFLADDKNDKRLLQIHCLH